MTRAQPFYPNLIEQILAPASLKAQRRRDPNLCVSASLREYPSDSDRQMTPARLLYPNLVEQILAPASLEARRSGDPNLCVFARVPIDTSNKALLARTAFRVFRTIVGVGHYG